MMLVHRTLKVGLVTIHEPLGRVPHLLTRSLLMEKIGTITNGLIHDWGIRNPRLAVLGLNPHAGEHGYIGSEEKRIIIPVIGRLRKKGIRLSGPYPADSFFSAYNRTEYDAVVAMYHDQGLIPLKMSASRNAVNVTLGLRILRTSPDHGTAFPIAGRGIADPSSMIEAIITAVQILRKRRRGHHR
jgi:4-hydroxythreonine-4-phosphate dehydrogenase